MRGGERKTHAQTTLAALRTARICLLNDALRRTGQGGRICLTASVAALGNMTIVAIIAAVRAFDAFSDDSDPYGEHDFGSVDVAGERIFWKIDYYDRTLEYGSPDPADPVVTTRVLTIMLAADY